MEEATVMGKGKKLSTRAGCSVGGLGFARGRGRGSASRRLHGRRAGVSRLQAAPGVGCTAGRLQGRDGGRGPGRLRDIGLGSGAISARVGVAALGFLSQRNKTNIPNKNANDGARDGAARTQLATVRRGGCGGRGGHGRGEGARRGEQASGRLSGGGVACRRGEGQTARRREGPAQRVVAAASRRAGA
eukprot:XP_020407911.1 spidroin-1-like [Zea mays]